MSRYQIYYFSVFIFCMMFASCQNNKIISDENKVASLYIELQLSLENNRGDLNKVVSERIKIFKKYNVTQEQYNKTLDYYGMDKEKWDEFFNTVNVQLNKMKKKI